MDHVQGLTHESMTVGNAFFAADPRPFELILVALVGCILVWGALELVHLVGRYMLKRRLGIDRIQQCLQDVRQVEAGLLNRIFANKDAVKALAAQTDTLRRKSDSLWQAIQDARDLKGRHIRVLGNEIKGNRCFVALVYNRHVEHWTQLGRSHAYIHDSWSKPQLIQVWAHSEAEAKKLLISRYPDTFGYVVIRLMAQPVAGTTSSGANHGG